VIINNLGSLNLAPVGTNCAGTFVADRPIAYDVKSSDGVMTSGQVQMGEYAAITPAGKAPFNVGVGFVNHSYWTHVTGVDSGDTVSFVQIWPVFGGGAGSGGGPTTVVTKS
jgi:hypothetical protein